MPPRSLTLMRPRGGQIHVHNAGLAGWADTAGCQIVEDLTVGDSSGGPDGLEQPQRPAGAPPSKKLAGGTPTPVTGTTQRVRNWWWDASHP